jgi:hypothetical protein
MKIIFSLLFISLVLSGRGQKLSFNMMDSTFINIIGMRIDSVKQRFKIVESEISHDQKYCLSHFKISGNFVDSGTRIFDSIYIFKTFFSINKQDRISLIIFMINHSDNQKIGDLLKFYFGKPDKTLNTGFRSAFVTETEDR